MFLARDRGVMQMENSPHNLEAVVSVLSVVVVVLLLLVLLQWSLRIKDTLGPI